MLKVLSEVIEKLPLIIDNNEWKSLDITYHPPHVERVYTSFKEYRVCLHVLHACKPGEALFHPHPWSSAVSVLSGAYQMGVGYGDPNADAPEVGLTMVANRGTQYEMIDPNMWHYVRPACRVLTIMVSGKPWKEVEADSRPELKPLSSARKEEILQTFKTLVSKPIHHI